MGTLPVTAEVKRGTCAGCGHEGTLYGAVGEAARCIDCMEEGIHTMARTKTTKGAAVPPQLAEFRAELGKQRKRMGSLGGDLMEYSENASGNADFTMAIEAAVKAADKALKDMDLLGLALLGAIGAASEGGLEEQDGLLPAGKGDDDAA